MSELLYGGIAELEEVKAALLGETEKKQESREAEKDLKSQQKVLESLIKEKDDKVEKTVKQKRNELVKEHEERLAVSAKSVKEAEQNKKDAVKAAVDENVRSSTASLEDENRRIKADVAALFKQHKVPRILGRSWVYEITEPSKALDFVAIAVIAIVGLFVIPFVVTRFIESDVLKIVVWLIIAVLVILAYAGLLFLKRKPENAAVVEKAKPEVMKSFENRKKITEITRSIKSDKNQEQYNLGAYDNAIDDANTEHEARLKKRDEEIDLFDRSTSQQIEGDIEIEYASRIDNLRSKVQALEENNRRKLEEYQEYKDLVDQYSSQLGSKNMTIEKIDGLIALIQEGKASNVSEALAGGKKEEPENTEPDNEPVAEEADNGINETEADEPLNEAGGEDIPGSSETPEE